MFLSILFLAEKFFAALEFPIVPVVLGRTNYSNFIPSSGFIDVKQFSTMINFEYKYESINEDDNRKDEIQMAFVKIIIL